MNREKDKYHKVSDLDGNIVFIPEEDELEWEDYLDHLEMYNHQNIDTLNNPILKPEFPYWAYKTK